MLPKLIDLFYESLTDNNNFTTFHPMQTLFKLPECNATVLAIFSDPHYHVIAMIISKDLQKEQILLILSLTPQNFPYIKNYITNASLIDLDLLEIDYLIL